MKIKIGISPKYILRKLIISIYNNEEFNDSLNYMKI